MLTALDTALAINKVAQKRWTHPSFFVSLQKNTISAINQGVSPGQALSVAISALDTYDLYRLSGHPSQIFAINWAQHPQQTAAAEALTQNIIQRIRQNTGVTHGKSNAA
jgi:hypothetical protein